jgi:integrase
MMNQSLYGTFAAQAAFLAAKFGRPVEPGWYVFPLCNRFRPVDPEKPATAIKTAWNSIREAAGVRCRFHDLRHTACTKMAEAGVPEATMKALMGHMSAAMLERYSHVREEAKRAAVEFLSLADEPISNGIPQDSPKVGASTAIQ